MTNSTTKPRNQGTIKMKYISIIVFTLLSILSSFSLLQVLGAPVSNQTNATVVAPINKTEEALPAQSTSQLPPRRSRPSDLSSREEETESDEEQQNNQQLSDLAETTRRDAERVGTGAFLTYSYIVSRRYNTHTACT